MSELLWISVPGGIDDSGRLLRVLVVPKLGGGTLEGSGMATWPPPRLLNGELTLHWRSDEDAATVDTVVIPDDVTIEAENGLWQRFFPPDTGVGSGRSPTEVPEVEVRATSDDATRIQDTFAGPVGIELAEDPDEPIPPAFEVGVLEGLEKNFAAPEPFPSVPPPPPAVAPAPPPDFHRTISLLREHPAVLRALGLIFELRVTPPDGLEAGQVKAAWPGAADEPSLPAIVSPWTAYGREFRPRSTDTIRAGMVALRPDAGGAASEDARWQVVTVDVDGGVRRLSDAAASLLAPNAERAAGSAAAGTPVSLPALRTAGVQLVRQGRQEDFARRGRVATENASRDSLEEHVLDADDLVLGYRIDIKEGNEWRSLHERVANYSALPGGQDDEPTVIGAKNAEEEGHIKAHGAVREGEGPLRADEVVARWSGWSLAARTPRLDGGAGLARRSANGSIPFDFDFQVKPGSLPSLRFTSTYELRARVVDMVGGGLSLDDDDADRNAITGIGYGRYEPVPAPGLMLEEGTETKDLGPGEAVDQIVVRSAPEVTVDEFADRNPGYVTHARRSLGRPLAALAIAEQHKMLDGLDEEEVLALMQRALAAGAANGAAPEAAPLPDPAASGIRAFPRLEPGAPADARSDEQHWEAPWPEPESKALELRGRQDGRRSAVKWNDTTGTLEINLEPAEQITLELSSVLQGDFRDHFALQEAMPANSKAAAEAGRHPLITPARTLTLVHAVRRPVRPPTGELMAKPRATGQTFAILDPKPAFLDIHANSTAQFDLTAAWTERNDDKTHEVEGAPVQSVIVHRDDTVLAEDVLRHEFGDTRHREVTYTMSAVSRFPQFFNQSELEETPEDFVARTELSAPVTILNTARPDPPVVIATRPAFVWSESVEAGPGGATLSRERLGGRLRIELARPWYQTGDGERLAVILFDREVGPEPPAERLASFTQVGRDPIWDTSDPGRLPTESMLSDAAGATGRPKLAETELQVLAIPYEPFFFDDRWYADVALPGVAASSYCPFVQLAVARYQPQSIENHDLSTVVQTEMTPLLPDRTLTVRREGERLFVKLAGVGPQGPVANRVDVVLEGCQAPEGMAPEAVKLSAFEPRPTAPRPGLRSPGGPGMPI